MSRPTDLGRLARDTVAFACRGTPVKCEFAIAPDVRAANVDEGQIVQVINNIAINAAQAMPAGGTLRVSVNDARLDAENAFGLRAGPYVHVVLRDSGVGIPHELLGRIFDPYFTTKQQGSGLGLAVTHSIVTKHAGHIAVQSDPGRGTTFEIYLPAAEVDEKRSGQAVDRALAPGRRVLVMDDEEAVRVLVLTMLHVLKAEGASARDGAEAVALYREAREAGRPFDAVLMDLTVAGGMGGRDATRTLLELDPRARVIVSSGYSTDPVMANYRAHGFVAVLAKPYRIGDLKAALWQVIESPDQLEVPGPGRPRPASAP